MPGSAAASCSNMMWSVVHAEPTRRVAAGGPLERDLGRTLDDRRLDRAEEVEPLADRAGGGEELVDERDVHRHLRPGGPRLRRRSGRRRAARRRAPAAPA